jgi:hypothetical protein
MVADGDPSYEPPDRQCAPPPAASEHLMPPAAPLTNLSALVVMGVSGAGKSTIGGMLARRLGWEYEDGDWFHPQCNIDKMHQLEPSARLPARRGIRPPRTGLAGDSRIGASLSASSVFDSDWRNPRSASISARRDRRISREKHGSSLSVYRAAASCVIHAGMQASELSGCGMTTSSTPRYSSRLVISTVSPHRGWNR